VILENPLGNTPVVVTTHAKEEAMVLDHESMTAANSLWRDRPSQRAIFPASVSTGLPTVFAMHKGIAA
jgi:hypothetical protein